MSVRSLLTVALALVFGISAAAGVNLLKAGGGATPAYVTKVVVAAADVPRGGMLTSELIKMVDYPRDLTPPGAATKPEDVLERAAITQLVKGEPVLDGKLAPKGAGRGLAALIPPGLRAFTIQTPNVATGVAGFILPGNKVDVLLTVNGEGDDGTGGGSTTTLLQNVEIMAVDQRIDAPADNKVDAAQLRSVTLLVTPDQAAKLDLGQNKGTLHLSLRNIEDGRAVRTRPATMAGLRFSQEKPLDERLIKVFAALGKALAERKRDVPPAAKAPAPPAKVAIRTIRGINEGQVHVELPELPAGDR